MKCQRRFCGAANEGSSRGPPLPADERPVPGGGVRGGTPDLAVGPGVDLM